MMSSGGATDFGRMSRIVFSAMFVAAAVFFVGQAAISAPRACLSDADARVQVQMHKLIGVEQALGAAKAKAKGDLISAHLCQVPDGFMYRIAIIGREGRVVKLLVDAASGHIVE